MGRRFVLSLSIVVAVLAAGLPAVAQEQPVPVPTAMAALGDSITRGFHAGCGLLNDCPENSWSTGSAIDSHANRLEDLAGTAVRRDNLAVTGADAGDLVSQAQGIAGDVGYVTVLMGANDACADTVGQMTPVVDFAADVVAGLDTVHVRAPGAAVFVASIPDLQRLLDVGKNSGWTRFIWSLYGICQSMLEDPLSTAQADVDRRAAVRQRVIDYNTELADACAAYAGTCRYDAGTVFGYPFQLSQLSTTDYFHPNVTGQQVLAAATWDAGFTWDTGEPPANQPPVADAGPDQAVTADSSGTATVTLDGTGSSDPDGEIVAYAWAWDGGASSGAPSTVQLGEGSWDVELTVTDDDGATATDTVTVEVDPYVAPNQPPVADAGPDQVVTADATSGEAQVLLDGSGSSDPDGQLVAFAWAWDGGASSGVTQTVDLGEGSWEVELTVTDDDGATATDTMTVVVEPAIEPPTLVELHVGDLDASAVDARRNRWDATVAVVVHDAGDQPVPGATVQGRWSGGANGAGSCVTDGSGTCTVSKSGVKGNQASVTFAVEAVTAVDSVYDAGANHDPDGDSDGTMVVVGRP